MTKRPILVTGATGFVGRMLCAELIRLGNPVQAALRDSASLGVAGCEPVKISNIQSDTDWTNALRGVDTVVHLAARVHVMHETSSDPLSAFRMVNTAGTENLARQAVRAGVRRFVYLSSIKVNGEQTLPSRPFTEADLPAPLDPYGVSKCEAEEGLRKIAQQTDMEVVIIRPPLVYGPGVKGNFLNMMRWLHKGVPLPLGAITNARSLIALENLIDLIVTCLHHPNAANQTLLVSDGEDLSTTELLKRTASAMGRKARLIPVPELILQTGARVLGKPELSQRLCGSLQVDISKAGELLGWKPSVTVDQALKKTVEHFLRNQCG